MHKTGIILLFILCVCEKHALLFHVVAFALHLLVFWGGISVAQDRIRLPGLHHSYWQQA